MHFKMWPSLKYLRALILEMNPVCYPEAMLATSFLILTGSSLKLFLI